MIRGERPIAKLAMEGFRRTVRGVDRLVVVSGFVLTARQLRRRAAVAANMAGNMAGIGQARAQQVAGLVVEGKTNVKPRVLVSHCRADDVFCRPFVAHLRAALSSRYLDGDIPPSDLVYDDQFSYDDPTALHLIKAWQDHNDQELATRPVVIVIVSQRAGMDSRLRAQVERVLQLGMEDDSRSIIPLLMEGADPGGLHPDLAAHDPIDMQQEGYDTAFADLLARVEQAAVRARVFVLPAAEVAPAEDRAGDSVAIDLTRALTPVDAFQRRVELLAQRYMAEREPRLTLQLNNQRTVRSHPIDQGTDRLIAEGELGTLTLLGRIEEAYTVANELCVRPDAVLADWIALARLTRVVEVPEAECDRTMLHLRRAVEERSEIAPLLARTLHLLGVNNDRESLSAVLDAMGFRTVQKGEHEVILPPTCQVSGGAFLMGSDARRDPEAEADGSPERVATVASYEIAQYPVTVAEYACFVAAGHNVPPAWRSQLSMPLLPVTNISWHDAVAYAAWLAEMTGLGWRLPAEAEWEKAARWDDARQEGRTYPWGNTFDACLCNTREARIGAVLPIGSATGDDSVCGARDMAGNVWEWTADVFTDYQAGPVDSDHRSWGQSVDRVVRGGSRWETQQLARSTCRARRVSIATGAKIGFRLTHGDGA